MNLKFARIPIGLFYPYQAATPLYVLSMPAVKAESERRNSGALQMSDESDKSFVYSRNFYLK